MLNYYQKLNVSTSKSFEVCDITENICAVVRESGVLEGMVTITSLHTTCALSVNENEERLFEDIRNFFLTIASPEASYRHNDLHLRVNIPPDEPENAHSHLRDKVLAAEDVHIVALRDCFEVGTVTPQTGSLGIL